MILVNFWATWCPPCREEIPALIALQKKYGDQLQIIGISQDSGSPDPVARFAEARGINYPVVMTTPEIEKLFPNVYALPTSFLIDRDGRIAQKHVGMLNPSLTEIETRSLAGLDVDARSSSRTTKTRSASKTPRRRTRFQAWTSRRSHPRARRSRSSS